MTDKELLELAAKAAKLDFVPSEGGSFGFSNGVLYKPWNPLRNDGEALRLAVKLGIQIWHRPGGVEGIHSGSILTKPQTEPLTPDPYAATRRAIVRAAAEIGKAIP